MEDIELLDAPQLHESAHEFRRPDVFRFAITKPTKKIHMIMDLAPMLYLRQHFPMTCPFLQDSPEEGRYELQIKVGNYLAPAGLTRLFPNQIHAVGGPGFRLYIKRGQNRWNDSE